jgi:hypothetical protein
MFRRPVIQPPFEALRINDRYLHEFIEGSSFCLYARQGRRTGQTQR